MTDTSRPAIGLVHGYGFSGAGSNLWTRSMLRALCRLGLDAHVVCQEADPHKFDFVTSAFAYDAEGNPRNLFERDTTYPGRCVVHRPDLEVLPVYVAPRQESSYVRPIPELDDQTIEEYVRRNANVLRRVALDHQVSGYCVNHVVLSSVAAQRVKLSDGVPYAVLPHGSAIEYVAKKDPRMMQAASAALAEADIVFALNGEMEDRMRDVFGSIAGLSERMERLPVGVDTSQFEAAERGDRKRFVDELLDMIRGEAGGRTAAQKEGLARRLETPLDDASLIEAIRSETVYRSEAPDDDIAASLEALDWNDARVVVYVGRLIAAKGAPSVVLAFPEILARNPGTKLIVAGTGALREAMEALVLALSRGDGDLVRRIIRLGTAFEKGSQPGEPLVHGQGFTDRLDRDRGWDAYIERAAQHLDASDVVFTGFLDHGPLSRLYAVADVGVFPSVVREASPLVVPEAAASGTLPVGTDYGGMGDSLKTLAESLPDEAARLMTARYEPEHTIDDIIANVSGAVAQPGRWAAELRRAAVERYDWTTIAERLAERLGSLSPAVRLPGRHG